jgi:hypothetical protein
MGCTFCATGQMGFTRDLTPDEIFEQVARVCRAVPSALSEAGECIWWSLSRACSSIAVSVALRCPRPMMTAFCEQAARFATELKAKDERLSNIVFMGMGEPFRNYVAVVEAAKKIMDKLGIGAVSMVEGERIGAACCMRCVCCVSLCVLRECAECAADCEHCSDCDGKY